MKTVKNFVSCENVNSKFVNLFGAVENNDNAQVGQLMLRLHELEATNAYLDNIVKAFTKKFAEVIATNAKYLSIIAHDLRSPFASILVVMEELNESLNDNDLKQSKEFIEMASNSASKSLNLLDNLLPWAVSQSKEKKIHPVKINLQELFANEIEIVNTSAKRKQIVLNHSVKSEFNVTADLQMVKTILRNLINNAIKFTNSGGRITLCASESKPFVIISVQDTGIGMSQEVKGKLFKSDVFHSTEGTNNEHGTGLGLLLCKEFVELHGGKIWIVSESGKGSEFKFTLPRYI